MNQLEDPRGPAMTPAQERNERVRNVVLLAIAVLMLAALALPPLL